VNVGDPCWRDASGTAVLDLPWRVVLPDGSTRTDPSQWSEDADVLDATCWHRSTLTAEDIAAMTPPSPPEPPGWATPGGWELSTSPEAVSSLSALWFMSSRRTQLGIAHGVTVTDTAGKRHSLTAAEFDALMIAYAAALEAANVAT
jgi:hypothetical protein